MHLRLDALDRESMSESYIDFLFPTQLPLDPFYSGEEDLRVWW
jgi:hypothetical protein